MRCVDVSSQQSLDAQKYVDMRSYYHSLLFVFCCFADQWFYSVVSCGVGIWLLEHPDAAMTLVQSFISCHLDYCNSLFSVITDSLLGRLQLVQNVAARLVTGTHRCDHITPVLRQLHWLLVRQRVDFKLVYKALHDATAAYIVDDSQLVCHAGRRRLRSADIDNCCSTDQHSVRRPELYSRWTMALEKSAGKDSPARQ